MNVLDENILNDQRELLLKWNVSVRQIGYEVGRKGMKDDEIIPFLLTLHRPTFFSSDLGFYRRTLGHARYCLVVIDDRDKAVAHHIRELLRHPEFDTQAIRMGSVIRIAPSGIQLWRLYSEKDINTSP